MVHKPMSTRDIKADNLPSKNILNTTLVTQLEVIENGVLKYYNWDSRSKVVAMIEDTGRTLRLYINHHKTEEHARHINVQGGELSVETKLS
jgi:phosphoglucomutase